VGLPQYKDAFLEARIDARDQGDIVLQINTITQGPRADLPSLNKGLWWYRYLPFYRYRPTLYRYIQVQ